MAREGEWRAAWSVGLERGSVNLESGRKVKRVGFHNPHIVPLPPTSSQEAPLEHMSPKGRKSKPLFPTESTQEEGSESHPS